MYHRLEKERTAWIFTATFHGTSREAEDFAASFLTRMDMTNRPYSTALEFMPLSPTEPTLWASPVKDFEQLDIERAGQVAEEQSDKFDKLFIKKPGRASEHD
jgi:hypothetical protein